MISCFYPCFQDIERSENDLPQQEQPPKGDSLQPGKQGFPADVHEEHHPVCHTSGCYLISSRPQLETATSLPEPASLHPARLCPPTFSLRLPLEEPSDEGLASVASPEGIALAAHLSTSGGSHNPAWDLPFRPPPIRVPAASEAAVSYGMTAAPHGQRERRVNNDMFDPNASQPTPDVDPIASFLNNKDQDEPTCCSRPMSTSWPATQASAASSGGVNTLEVLAVAQQQLESDPVQFIYISCQSSSQVAAPMSRQSRLSRVSTPATGGSTARDPRQASASGGPALLVADKHHGAEVMSLLEVDVEGLGHTSAPAGYMLPSASDAVVVQPQRVLDGELASAVLKSPGLSSQFLMQNSCRLSSVSSVRDTWGSCDAPGLYPDRPSASKSSPAWPRE